MSGAAQSDPRRRLTLPRALGSALALGALWVALLRPPVVGTSLNTEDGWRWGLGVLLLRKAQIGAEWIYTYGPLGFFMDRGYVRDLFVAGWIWDLAIKGVFALVACWFLLRQRSVLVRSALYGALLCLPANDDDVGYGVLILLSGVQLLRSRPRGHWAYVGTGLLLSVLGLLKFPLLLLGAFTVLVVAVGLWMSGRRRTAGAWSASFALGVPAAWSLAGQSLAHLPDYLRAAFEMAKDYPDAMVVEGPWLQVAAALALLGCVAAALIARRPWSSWGGSGVGCVALFAASFLLFFKEGFVRQDPAHALRFFAFALPAILALPCALEGLDWRANRRRLLLLAGALVAGGGQWHAMGAMGDAGRTWPDPLHNLVDGWRALAQPGALRQELEDALDGLRARNDMPRSRALVTRESVDVLGNYQAAALINRMNWAPRYCFQSYAAYSDRSAERNAAHFSGPGAPRFVMVDGLTIDDHYPTAEDGPAIVRVLQGYRPVAAEAGFLLLQKAGEKTLAPLRTLRQSLRPGLAWDLPETGLPLLLRVRCRKSWRGILRSAWLRPSELLLSVETEEGPVFRQRFVPSLETSSFLLSPLLLDLDDWIEAYVASGYRRRVVRLQFEEPAGAASYASFEVELDVLPELTATSIGASEAAALHAQLRGR